MKLNSNDMMQKNEESESGIIGIPNMLNAKEWNDIGTTKLWTRKCPGCGSNQTYSRKSGLTRAITKNRLCNKCTMKSYNHIQNLKKSLTGRRISETHKMNISRGMKGRKITWKSKISKSLTGRKTPEHQEIKRLESRLKMSYSEYCKQRPEFLNYKSRVMSITRRQPIFTLKDYDKTRGLAGTNNGYQLDHIVSIKDGFINKINPFVIGNVRNLKFIPWKENLNKNRKSDENALIFMTKNTFPDIEVDVGLSKFNPKLYRILSAITDAWFENPNISKEEAIQLVKKMMV